MSKPIHTALSARTRLCNMEPSQGLGTEFLLYETKDRRTYVEWGFLSGPVRHLQAMVAETLQTRKHNISFYVRNVLGKRLANKKGHM